MTTKHLRRTPLSSNKSLQKAGPNWVNQTIWTEDNLSIMRGMNSESVDLIYLDPPFNSKTDYAAPIGSKAAGAMFKDTWTLSEIDVEWINLLEDKFPNLKQVLLAASTKSNKSYLTYMSVRLLEMRRILKSTGSIYLHCDPTMSHYLKIVMDVIFGHGNYRNEITWKRTTRGFKGSQHKPKRFNTNTDIILFYVKSNNAYFNSSAVLTPYEKEDLKNFKKEDEKGVYYLDTAHNRRSASARPNLCYEYQGLTPPFDSGWKTGLERMIELDESGELVRKDNKLYRKIRPREGKIMGNLWTDLTTKKEEMTHFKTQKPVALLQRIIQTSSKIGDIVFDPFCGCATTCIAAEIEQRQWVGIDISPKATELVKRRFLEEIGRVTFNGVTRSDIPKRTDLGYIPPHNCKANRIKLYGLQLGICTGCREHFESRHLEVDHIIARSKGGTDHIDNLQLLCSSCNSTKGNRGMEYLRHKLQFGN